MTRPAIGTIATRVAVMGSNLLVMAVAGHTLGTEGLGTIGLIVLGIALVMLLNNVVGGGALVYLTPRFPPRRLLPPCYAWALFTAIAASLLLWTSPWPLVPEGYAVHVVALALLQSFQSIHTAVLLGRERIGTLNMVAMAQSLMLLAVFAALVIGGGARSPMAYVHASYASFGLGLLLSTLVLRGGRWTPNGADEGSVWKELFRHGTRGQTANVLQLLNYRLAYWLIEAYHGRAALGLYTVASQVVEASWVVPRSLGMVLYARVSNTTEAHRQRELALVVLKVATAFTMALSILLVIVPDVLFQAVFGPEVTGLTPLLLLLAPGIVAMAGSQALSHWFSGTGRNGHNAVGSGIGLACTLVGGFLLVPWYGSHGAALVASLAYGASVLYQVVVFLRVTGLPVTALLPGPGDARRVARAWREALRR